jgi:hypothetical protein
VIGLLREYLPAVVGAVVGLWYPAAFLRTAVRAGREGAGRDSAERLTLVDGFLAALLALLFAWLWVPWQVVPPALWGVLVGVVGYGVVRAAEAWRAAPWVRGDRPATRVAGTAGGGLFIAALFVLALA